MASIIRNVSYRDFDYRFLAHPSTGKLVMRKNSESIKQAVRLLIMTNLGERQYNPRYGSRVRSSLFENYTSFTEENLRQNIEECLSNFEPRIELLQIRFGGDPDRNELIVSIIFRPINTTETVELNISMERVR